jgi:hypothetical protein
MGPWDIVDGAEDVIEMEEMEVLVVVKEVKGKVGECRGRKVNIAVREGREDCVRGC